MNTLHKSLSLLEYQIFVDKIENINYLDRQLITTINQYSYCIAETELEFKKSLQKSEILLPDGVGIVFAAKILKKKKIKKIAGADIHNYLLSQLNANSGKCMYLGASENTLSKIQERLAIEYPNINLKTYSPPYKKEFSEADNSKMISEVNNFSPDVLFVGMTAPKQEKWAYKNRKKLNTKTICAIGAVFDFYAGTVKRPSNFWIKLKLEWFIRLVKEPKRMWKRYVYYGPFFVFLILKLAIKGR